MKKTLSLTAIFLLLPLFIFAEKAAGLQVRNIWTLRPVAGAAAVIAGDTLLSDQNGFFHFKAPHLRSGKGRIFKKGYFTEILSPQVLRRKIIYLVPQMSTEAITVIRPRTAAPSLSMPSNISRLDVRQALAAGRQTVDELLGGQEGLFIKSYGGSGQLQTISLRGMAAAQTQVLFDGVPLNNLQLGSADLSEYDLQNLSAVAVYRGGNSLLDGSAGTVNLLPDSIHNTFYYAARLRFASFRNEAYSLRLDVPAKRLFNSISIKRSLAENRYRAVDADGRYVNLQNRDFERWQLTLRSRFRPAKKWEVQSWFSSFKHSGGAAKPFVNAASEHANLARKSRDVSLAKIKLRHTFKRGQLQAQTFVRNEWMTYTDPAYVMHDQPLHSGHFNQLVGFQAAARILFFNDLLIHSGAQWYRERINSTEAGKHQRRRGVLFLNSDYLFFSRKRGWLRSAHLNAQLRLEYFAKAASVFLPAAGLSLRTTHGRIYGSFGKNYRRPSFNDLYWQPGGNPLLRAEHSLHGEAGYEHTRRFNALMLRFNADVYANRVSDQIKWLPASEYWTPQNISSVFSRGVELNLTLSDSKDINRLTMRYTYGKAEKDKAEFAGDQTVGHQLPFLPREQIFVQARSAWRSLYFGLRLNHASFRYFTLQNDAAQILPAFTTVDAWLTIAKHFAGQHWQINFSVLNLFDLRYQVIAGYPMPPRSFRIGFNINKS